MVEKSIPKAIILACVKVPLWCHIFTRFNCAIRVLEKVKPKTQNAPAPFVLQCGMLGVPILPDLGAKRTLLATF